MNICKPVISLPPSHHSHVPLMGVDERATDSSPSLRKWVSARHPDVDVMQHPKEKEKKKNKKRGGELCNS